MAAKVSPGNSIAVDKIAVMDLIQGLKMVVTPAYLDSKLNLPSIATKAATKLKNVFFPKGKRPLHPDRKNPYTGNLGDGWHVLDVSDYKKANSVGFTIANTKGATNERVQTILASLDKGSRGYGRDVKPGNFATSFIGKPGRARLWGGASLIGGEGWLGTKHAIYVPHRRPLNYIEKTYRFIDDLLAGAYPNYVRAIRTDMRRRGSK